MGGCRKYVLGCERVGKYSREQQKGLKFAGGKVHQWQGGERRAATWKIGELGR